MSVNAASAGITINGKHSFRDFGAFMCSHSTGTPEPFVVRESVPFMEGFYDFSAISGTLACTSRTAEYVFELENDDEALLEVFKNGFIAWLLEAVNVDIYDDYDPGYHMRGSIAEAPEWSPVDPWCGQISVKFLCQPKRTGINGSKVY